MERRMFLSQYKSQDANTEINVHDRNLLRLRKKKTFPTDPTCLCLDRIKDRKSQIFNFAALFPDFHLHGKKETLRGGGQTEQEMGVFTAYSLLYSVSQF